MATYGNELGVPWQWTNSLHIHVGGIAVAPHDIHGLSVSGINGNLFYGSFSIVSKKAIINTVKDGKLFGNCKITVARMAAFQIYESSYPKVFPTSFEIDAGVKESKTDQLAVAASICLHRYPEKN